MTYRILSFCGGGIRGLLSAGFLNQLYQANNGILANASMLAGTSTGSDIIALIRAGFTPPEIYEFYQKVAPQGFEFISYLPDTPGFSVTDLYNAQLGIQKLAIEAQEKLGKPVNLGGPNPPLSEVTPDILITSFNVSNHNGQGWQPLLLNNLEGSSTSSTPLVDAVVSSSSMPAMYGSFNGNIDGAFVNHDPTLAAIALAVSKGVQLSDIAVICFGTGFMPNWIASDTSTWGALQWQNGDGNPDNQLPSLLVNGTVSPILNACLNGTSTNLIAQLSGLMLGATQSNPVSPRYAYINPTLDRIISEIDTQPADLEYMEGLVTSTDISHAIEVLSTNWPTTSAASA